MLLIQNGLLYTMEEEKTFHGDILIKNGKIEKIADKITADSNMEIIDAKGLNVFPGFIDAHSHIGISEEKVSVLGDSCNEGTNPVTPTMRAIDAINPMDSAFHNALAVGKALSMGLIASIARMVGVRGLVPSLQLSPSTEIFSSDIPRWLCASIKPGNTSLPLASIIFVLKSISIFSAILAILPSLINKSP